MLSLDFTCAVPTVFHLTNFSSTLNPIIAGWIEGSVDKASSDPILTPSNFKWPLRVSGPAIVYVPFLILLPFVSTFGSYLM